MRNRILLSLAALVAMLLLATPMARAQTASTTPAASTNAMFFGIGAEYNHYSTPATYATTADFGVKLAGTNFYSISTLEMQQRTATVRTGVGYLLKHAGLVSVIATMDGGVTTTTTTTASGTTTNAPAIALGNLALGNVGGGVLVMYDLGTLNSKLANVHAVGGFREAAVAGTSVSPEFIFKLSYSLK
jgi:hypothetical protein